MLFSVKRENTRHMKIQIIQTYNQYLRFEGGTLLYPDYSWVIPGLPFFFQEPFFWNLLEMQSSKIAHYILLYFIWIQPFYTPRFLFTFWKYNAGIDEVMLLGSMTR